MTTQPVGDLATPGEVASYLRTTERALAQMRYRGGGPKFVKVNGRVLYRWTDIQSYIDGNTHEKTHP